MPTKYGDDFIVASYLKWVESAGGRGVRIPYNATKDELDVFLKSVNGVLFPGANFHFLGILEKHFDDTALLKSFYKKLATSEDKQGQTYVAAIEAFDYPIYGVQFHPEKNPYEIGDDKTGGSMNLVDHSYEAIVTSQAFAHFFIGEARRNNHSFANPEEEKAALLLNYELSNRSYPYFESTTVFKLP
ncbi:hypothetical protein Ae201684P_002226 [Aphanomyces euteiches]|nr:hypothetical protein Ae201684P_002226 [Aphanomyces euteiches]